MGSQKRIIINTFGSFGDIHPYMSLALELQARGHVPVIATMEFYREKIEGAGIEFAPVRPNFPHPKDQDPELIKRIMEPMTGARFLIEGVILPAVRDAYEDLLAVVRGAHLLITHPAAPAGPLVGRKTGMPWISSVLAPFSFYSAYDPPVAPFWFWTKKLRVLGPTVMGFLLRSAMSLFKAREFADFRKELGLADYGNPMFEGQHSPTLALALFSSVLGEPQPDWPKQAVVTGFCFYDGHHQAQSPPELDDFLDRGAAPIVFTLGSTAVWVARDFFRESIEAAKRLGRRAVLLIGDDRNRPASLPDDIIAVDYAPYQTLLPRAAAVVHSGGVGTTAQGLLSGAPTLIVPFAFDQADNAERASRLGTSRTLYRDKYFAPRVVKELGELLGNPAYAEQANTVSEQLKRENGPARASDLIEQLLTGGGQRMEELTYASGD